MPLTPLNGDLTVQEVSRRSGLTESALRYYERIGLIGPVPRDPSSGHRRYPPALVEAIESLSCLRSTGMSVRDMRAYVDNMARGVDAAGDQRQLFADHATRLADEIERLELRRRYVAAKARLWAAAAGQRYLAAAGQPVPLLRELTLCWARPRP